MTLPIAERRGTMGVDAHENTIHILAYITCARFVR